MSKAVFSEKKGCHSSVEKISLSHFNFGEERHLLHQQEQNVLNMKTVVWVIRMCIYINK